MQEAKRAALREQYDLLLADGLTNLGYVPGPDLLDGDTATSPTVEGTHLTDIGMLSVANYYSQYLPAWLLRGLA